VPAFLQVNVPSRSSTTDKLRRGPFRARSRQSVESPTPPEPRLEPEVKVTRMVAPVRSRRAAQLESELDRTTYSCSCGFVFQAAVLTSVACPHCGDSQAW
jgi:hypothetical protein